jgi:acyl dehydratase
VSPARLTEGAELEPLVVESVPPEKMKLMAALLRDPNPIHFDAEAVRSDGMGDRVINQGPINQAYLVNLVTRAAGGPDRLRSIQVRFLGNVLAGDRVECRGRVAAVDEAAGTATLEIEARVGDAPVLAGTAVVTLGP